MRSIRNTFRNYKLFTKVSILVLTSIIFMGVVVIIGLFGMNRMNGSSKQMYNNAMLPMNDLYQYRVNMQTIELYALEMVLTDKLHYKEQFAKKMDEVEEVNKELLTIILDRLEVTDELLEELNKALERYSLLKSKVTEYALNEKNSQAYLYYQSYVRDVSNQINDILNNWIEMEKERAISLNDRNQSEFITAVVLGIVSTLVAIILLVMITLLISRSITGPVRAIQILMARAQKGDLTVYGNYKSEDEIGVLTYDFNQMISGLRELIKKVNENAIQLSANSEELTASAEETAAAANHVAQAIQEVASGADNQRQNAEDSTRSMEEVAIGIQNIAESSSDVAQLATAATKEAEAGNQSLQKVINQMGSIQTTVNHSATIVQELGIRSEEIGQIVEIISSIAAQTNLLALNAAIEAARAGEQGRGFAVVADEVRKLAEQSESSAAQITTLIEQIQNETRKAVLAMEQGNHEVDSGMATVQETSVAFRKIVQVVQKVADLTREVSSSTEQISASTEEVTTAVEEMERIAKDALSNTQNVVASTEEQLATIEEVAAASESLNQMAQDLQKLISSFKY